jgi:uncharacterized protein YraI
MHPLIRRGLAATTAVLLSGAGAAAEEGFARAATNLRAGPAAEYP